MSDREYIPLVCDGCGAPLPENLRCKYCGMLHERTLRYRGPDVPLAIYDDVSVSMMGDYSSMSSYSTYSTYLPGTYSIRADGSLVWMSP